MGGGLCVKWLVSLLTLLTAGGAQAQAVRRFALIVGANDGGPGRERLRYALSDAHQVAHVLTRLGGVTPQDLILLEEPRRAVLLRALEAQRAELLRARPVTQRLELVVYYSGHSDGEGLLLRGEHAAYLELRRSLDAMPADVRVVVLDSCLSGAFTRLKGGSWGPAFLTDASSEVTGAATLTSSSADEASQESDELGGSFFTHSLIAGLRGAADTTRDGRVTLGEAYRYAFDETLARTQRTRGGPQHASYDLQLTGTGEVVLSDLRSARSTLRLPAQLAGALFVRDGSGRLTLEAHKLAGQPMDLALAPGPYTVLVKTPQELREGDVTLDELGPRTLVWERLRPVAADPVRPRGGAGRRPPNTLGYDFSGLIDAPPEFRFEYQRVAQERVSVYGQTFFALTQRWTDEKYVHRVGLAVGGRYFATAPAPDGLFLDGRVGFDYSTVTELGLGGTPFFTVRAGVLAGYSLSLWRALHLSGGLGIDYRRANQPSSEASSAIEGLVPVLRALAAWEFE